MTAASDTCRGDSNRLANLAVASKDPVAIADYAIQALGERKPRRLIEAALKPPLADAPPKAMFLNRTNIGCQTSN